MKNLSALDEIGNPIDWWFIYKVPKITSKPETTGYEYVYYDPSLKKLSASPYLLTSEKGALNLTLQNIFKNPTESMGWILYNDEMPANVKGNDVNIFGHTKGVLAFDLASKTAFWLLHSWPQYVDQTLVKEPTPLYGQTFLCLSISLDTCRKIASQMANHQVPQVFLPRVPSALSESDPLYLLTKKLNPNVEADSDVLDFKTLGGMSFKVFAKNKKWNKDFWNQLVGPGLKSDMDVETWIRGAIPSVKDSDGVHKIIDVKFIDFNPLGIPWLWPETKDHAKWGITVDSDWVCVGDINRMISQEKRGGGAIAFQNKILWSALKKTELITPPVGLTVEDTKKLIKKTHT